MKPTAVDIYKMKETVLTMADLAVSFPGIEYANLKRKLFYWARTGKLRRVRRRVYVKDNYNRLELANKLVRPSYISFETVLVEAGVIFQRYETVFLASKESKEIETDGNKFIYRRLDEKILLNPVGVDRDGLYFKASRERAFLDTLYLKKDSWFDNLASINWDKVFEMLPIYDNKRLTVRVRKYFKDFGGGNV